MMKFLKYFNLKDNIKMKHFLYNILNNIVLKIDEYIGPYNDEDKKIHINKLKHICL